MFWRNNPHRPDPEELRVMFLIFGFVIIANTLFWMS